MRYVSLTQEQVDHFIEHGYLILRQAFSPEVASRHVDQAFARLGYSRTDPSTWAKDRIHMPSTQGWDTALFAPSAYMAACDLAGGEQRVELPWKWADGYIFNLGLHRQTGWKPPSPASPGWHKDGDFFLHFLDSPEQGLLTIVCWTDMLHQGGGTFIAPDSVGVVARYLAEHPEGVDPFKFPIKDLIGQCHEFIELTGRAGDVVIHHPFMLHAASANVLGVERAITNPPIHLKEPMNFNRSDPSDFSPVERAILRGLGVERFDFKSTRPREKIVPERVKIQQKMLEEERARAASIRQ